MNLSFTLCYTFTIRLYTHLNKHIIERRKMSKITNEILNEQNSFNNLNLELSRRMTERVERAHQEQELLHTETGEFAHSIDKKLLGDFAEEMHRSVFGQSLGSVINEATEKTKKSSYNKLDQELRKEDKKDAVDHLPEGTDLLKEILQDVSMYSTISLTANNLKNITDYDTKKREERLAKRIMRRLEKLQAEMEAQNEAANLFNAQLNAKIEEEAKKRNISFEELHDSEEYKAQFKAFADDRRQYVVSCLTDFFENQLYGQLGTLPEQPIEEDALHIVDHGEYIKESSMENHMVKGQYRDDIELEEDHRNNLMFPHSPSPDDVVQAQIGDCFFASVLSEMAAKHPQKIKEMIRDNRNGTATVRLYHRVKDGDAPDAFEPFYVTVTKKMTKGQAHQAQWVQTLERALAVSGLIEHAVEMQKARIDVSDSKIVSKCPHPYGTFGRKPPANSAPSYSSIEGSDSQIVMYSLLGNDAITKSKTVYPGLSHVSPGPIRDDQVHPIRIDRQHTNREKQYADLIDKAIKAGGLISAISYDYNGDDGQKVIGIAKSHEYSVLGIEEKMIEGHAHKFVKIRNPHGKTGRDYTVVDTPQGRKLQAVTNQPGIFFPDKPTNSGITYIELKDFTHEFEFVNIAAVKESRLEKADRIAVREQHVMDAYKNSFKEIYKYLDSKVSSFRGSSKEYDALKKALKTAYKKPAKNYAELENHIETLSEAMDAYLLHTTVKTDGDKTLRMFKQNACNALSVVISAASVGYMKPKAYAAERLADRLLDDFVSLYDY